MHARADKAVHGSMDHFYHFQKSLYLHYLGEIFVRRQDQQDNLILHFPFQLKDFNIIGESVLFCGWGGN